MIESIGIAIFVFAVFRILDEIDRRLPKDRQ